MSKIVGLLLFVAGAAGLFFSMREIIRESRIVRAYLPVPAIVLFSDTAGLAQGRASTYFPIIRYRYSIDGKPHDSSRIWPYVGTIYRPEAQKLMHDFPQGGSVSAYVDPDHSDDAVLVRDYSSFPYWPAALSIIIAAIGCGNVVRLLHPRRRKMETVVANNFGWRLLMPGKRFTERFHESIFLLLAIGVPIVGLGCHLAVRSERVSNFDMAFYCLSLTIFVVLAAWVKHTSRILRRVSDLRVMVNSAPMRLDKPFVMRVEADIRSRVQISEMRARVICIKRNLLHNGRRTHLQNVALGERVLRLAGKSALPRGEILKGTSETIFKADNWPPSGSDGLTRYPCTLWELRIEVVGPTRFTVTFPLEVIRGDIARANPASARQRA